MGLPGWRRATTTPGRANARKPRRTCHPSPKSRAGQASGTYRTVSASASAPRMTADRRRCHAEAANTLRRWCPRRRWPCLPHEGKHYARIVPGTLPLSTKHPARSQTTR